MHSTFATRTEIYLKAAASAAQKWYDAKGQWLLTSIPPGVRERYWLCFSLYHEGLNELADAVILAGDATISHMGKQNPTPFDIFHTNIAAVLLKAHQDKMSAATRQRLEEMAKSGLPFQPGNRRLDYQFHGFNDNMPAKASMGLILTGEMFDEPDAVEHGLWNLRQCRNMLFRRGMISEWNSPTYSAGTLSAFAKISHYAQNDEAREIAAGIEERIWLDLAARFHPSLGVLSGPYSRAYTIDSIAHMSDLSSLLWFILGDAAKPSPLELFNLPTGLVLHHMGDAPFNISARCWLAAGSYHPSERVLEMFAQKSYPFRAVANSEVGTSAGFDSHPIRIETFLEEDFTVGTSSTTWLGGHQTAPYQVTYKRAEEVASFRDVGTVYHKFTINDEVPGTIRTGTDDAKRPCSNSGEADVLESHSHVVTVQSGPTVLALTTPHLMLGGQVEDDIAPKPLTRLDEMIVFSSHFGGVDEVQIGNESRETWSGEVPRGEWIGCRRGRLLIALRPLVFLHESKPVKITLEHINNYDVLRTTFYHGPERLFTRKELKEIYGGFVAEHASVAEYPSLAAFMESLAATRITDYFWSTRRARYRRPANEQRSALELEMSWTPAAVSTRYSLINGEPVSLETKLAIDGLTDADFPFLTQPWTSVPSYFPWEKVEADWGSGHSVGAVGDRESD